MQTSVNMNSESMNGRYRQVSSLREAEAVTGFLLGADCFDDQRFTPGEEEQLRLLPMASIAQTHLHCWYEFEGQQVIAAILFVENEHRSGGYRLEYFGVHRTYRQRSRGEALLQAMIAYCQQKQGRYIETFTCDLDEYQAARRLFERSGFEFKCHLPDYYYPGEGKLLYFKQL